MQEPSIAFMALGGGQRVGASCYYLRLGGSHVLLDCGLGLNAGVPFAPNLYKLIETGLMDSFNQIGQIFISHAHWDHVGYMADFAAQCGQPVFYLTEITKVLSHFQIKTKMKSLRKRKIGLDVDSFFAQRVVGVSYGQEIPFRDYQVSFLEAGHIPGAMMTLFTVGNRRLLYTGDYSLKPTSWTSGCSMPAEEIDVLILCGLHARHPYVVRGANDLERIGRRIYENLLSHRSIYCRASQLSKGIELIRYLETTPCRDYPLFIDDNIYAVVRAMESLGIPVLSKNVAPLGVQRHDEAHAVIGTAKWPPRGHYRTVYGDFSLHDDFAATVDFIKEINPKIAFIVHSPPSRYHDRRTLEQEIMADARCHTQCIFAENEDIYEF
ncbi:MAG: MBL fold metallo-hydrolase [Selenomonadaceae bacterium]|nr:MBL fold metallo-hydrolase [Selenomonadaceae bacterium]